MWHEQLGYRHVRILCNGYEVKLCTIPISEDIHQSAGYNANLKSSVSRAVEIKASVQVNAKEESVLV